MPMLATLLLATQAAAVPAEALARCAQIADDAARLACFDALALSVRGQDAEASQPAVAAPPAPSATPSAPAAPPDRAAQIDAFGAEDLPETLRPAVLPATQIESFEAMAVAVRHQARGRETIELDNGQVWRQSASARSLGLRIDGEPQPVTVRRGLLGSYLICNPANNRCISVRRIR